MLPDAPLIETREFLPGHWLQTYHAPRVAAGAQPGQYVQVWAGDWTGSIMRRPFAINTFDRSAGTITIHFEEASGGAEWLSRAVVADAVSINGPLGRPFAVDPKSRHILLIAIGAGIAGVRALADKAIAGDRRVTVLFGAATAAEVYPSSLLPDEVEYVVATDDGSFGHRGSVVELIPQFEAWADQAFASGPMNTLSPLARAARDRQARLGVARLGARRGRSAARLTLARSSLRRAWLQVNIEQTMVCALATCLGCVIMGIDGPQRVCREGSVFAAEEIAWEEGQ